MMEIIKNPLVCVCVPAYNAEGTIIESLRSILGQDYANLKVTLVDNASTDRTVELARGLAETDGRLEIVTGKKNIGGEANFTRCIQLAGGDYTAIYHADDVYTPGMVSAEADFLSRNPEAGAVFTGAAEIDGQGLEIGRRRLPFRLADGRAHAFGEVFSEVLRRGNFMICPSAMVRTGIYKTEIKTWNGDKFKTSADLDVWLRIAEKHHLGFIDRPLMNYRVSPFSHSYNLARLRTTRHDMFLVLAHYAGKNKNAPAGGRGARDLELLLLKDNVNIAINHIIKGDTAQARARLAGIFSLSNILDSLRGPAQFKFLVYGYAAWLLSFLPLGRPGRALVAKARHNG